jgi:NADPH:quinone reductase-like Zn-dependent oxidoreductase
LRAVLRRRYGGPDVLSFEEVPTPAPRDDEVLIRIRAAAVNPYDRHFMRGSPYPLRLASGLRQPTDLRLGVDVAGDIEAVGSQVAVLSVGDAVFGGCRGAFAEYGCPKSGGLAKKPAHVSYEHAACVNIAGLTALQALRDHARLRAGQTILINGASGGVGTLAVQIAKAFGATVTGVCSTRNLEMVGSIGADRVVDYTREDFTRASQRYDVILDTIGNHSPLACRRVLTLRGTCVAVGASTGAGMVRMVAAPLLSRFVGQRFTLARARHSAADLAALADLMSSGKLTPVIDRRFALRDTAAAMAYMEAGHVRGKIVINVA